MCLLALKMRVSILISGFLLMVGALYLLWQYRFERSPKSFTIRLADLKTSAALGPGVHWSGPDDAPGLRLQVNPAPSGQVARFELPIAAPIDFLHLKVRISSRQLIPGKEYWEDGRGLIEWHQANGKAKQGEWENDGFGSARWNEEGKINEFVMRPDRPPALPVLRLENLGLSGEFELSVFEASVVRERWVWKIGRWVLVLSWIAWAIAWIRPRNSKQKIRATVAGLAWILAGIYFAVPGPWKIQRSFGSSFELGGPARFMQEGGKMAATNLTAPEKNVPSGNDSLQSVGEIPHKGDLVLRLKYHAKPFRTLLHGLLLFGPTFLIACLVGRRSAVSLAMILAIAIEIAQCAFGYGFDLTDLVDLACDAIGIALAILTHFYLKQRFVKIDLA